MRTGLIGLVAGLGLVLAAVVLWAAGTGAAPVPAAAPAPAASTTPAAELDVAEPAPPVRVRVGSIDVDAPVVPVGVDERGEMAVPADVRTIGWYRYGSGPGTAAGSSVLSGHVDDREQGPGAFVALREVAGGDLVEVDLADGTTLRYAVRSVEDIDKEALPVERLFDRSGPSRLTLVTCGGDFDASSRAYRNNVVVTAEPVR